MATADITLLDAWIAREDMFDAFLSYNHAFKEFNRVLRGEEIAATLTLGDVAVMVHSPVEDLVAIANGSDPEPAPTLRMQGDEERPAWMDGIDLTGAVTVATRPIFESGHEPLEVILAAVNGAGPDDLILVEAPFCPTPLRRLLATRGYESCAEELASSHWRCTFRPA